MDKALRPQQDITRHWKTTGHAPVVSVCCPAYNHAQFLPRMLDSVLAQESTFRFELLVHDDASTDDTPAILARYQAAYPEIVRVITQTENQYSQLPVIAPRFLFPEVRGQYIALCEGDDCWTATDKLQRQVEVMEQNDQLDLCFHPVSVVDAGGRVQGSMGTGAKGHLLVGLDRIVLGGGGYCPTPSVLFRSSVAESITACVKSAPFSDKFIQIIAAARGGAIYIQQEMAAYRRGHAGTWTAQSESAAALARRESLIADPYAWLMNNMHSIDATLLRYSLADQYAVIARSYQRLNDTDSVSRILGLSAQHFAQAGGPGPLIARLMSMPGVGRATLPSYPALRSLYRWTRLLRGDSAQ